MNTDIRLKLGFFQNPKVRKLRMKHGADAVLALQELWLFTAEHRPTGVLYDMDEDDINAICGPYTERILAVLLELKFVDFIDGVYVIHQWKEHQTWAANAPARSENARNAVLARWNKSKTKQPVNTDSIRSVYEENTDGNTPILSLPNLKDKHSGFKKPSLEEVTAYCQERGNFVVPNDFIDHYTANGWKVGKNAMKDWKAAVRTWEKNHEQPAKSPSDMTLAEENAWAQKMAARG